MLSNSRVTICAPSQVKPPTLNKPVKKDKTKNEKWKKKYMYSMWPHLEGQIKPVSCPCVHLQHSEVRMKFKIFWISLFLFYMYGCLSCMYVCSQCGCSAQWGTEEGVRYPGTRVRDSRKPPCDR